MRYKSELTSINHVPAMFWCIDWKADTANIDYGGGRFETTTEFLRKHGVENFVYDPYNRSHSNNKFVLEGDYDTGTICNVLNVIPSKKERLQIMDNCFHHVDLGGTTYICVYAGNNSGVPSVSKKRTWQANKPLDAYMKEIYTVFSTHGTLHKVGSFEYVEIVA